MVCLPCIVLPIFLYIYIRFIQPLVMRFVPEQWRARFDAVLYPTCPVRPPPPAVEKNDGEDGEEEVVASDDGAAALNGTGTAAEVDACCQEGNKKTD